MPFASSVLVATDLSPASYAALAEAARVAALGATQVCVLHVFDVSAFHLLPPGVVLSQSTLRRIAEEANGAALSVLSNLRARFFASLSGSRIDLRTVEHEGAAAGICATAATLGADLIVIGSHGRSALGLRAESRASARARSPLGSVTEKVVRAAACRVLVVPSEDAESHTH